MCFWFLELGSSDFPDKVVSYLISNLFVARCYDLCFNVSRVFHLMVVRLAVLLEFGFVIFDVLSCECLLVGSFV